MGLGLSLGTVLAVTSGVLPRFFTSDPAVITAIGNIFPFVILSQPINALAFVWDGVLYGAGGFEYAAKVTRVSLSCTGSFDLDADCAYMAFVGERSAVRVLYLLRQISM